MNTTGTDLSGMRVTVMGLGRFGGGIGAARFLAESGACVTVTDLRTETDLADSIRRLDGLDIRYVLGRHDPDDFTGADMVVASPAVPRDSIHLEAARCAGVEVRTEIGLFVERCPATVCGITGSNGKTTTVSMLSAILDRAGKKHRTGGNIGGSLLLDLPDITPDETVVLELSSFQLEWLREQKWSPHIAAVLNILPNHLDRHGTFDNYKAAKRAILDFQAPDDYAVLVGGDPGSRSLARSAQSRIVWVGGDPGSDGVTLRDGSVSWKQGEKTVPVFDAGILRVPGSHMVVNAMTAAACALLMDVAHEHIAPALASFRGLPHRLEYVGERDGVRFFNDSKATTPEAAAAGVAAFDCHVCVILGGSDKKVGFDGLARAIAGRVRYAALIGETAPALSRALASEGIDHTVHDSLEAAFRTASELAEPGDIVLLSPACASYDMFANYEDRGDAFKGLVREWCGGVAS